jgi:H+/Cl- antiporter ClcA
VNPGDRDLPARAPTVPPTRAPPLYITGGGVVLGVLGAIGGPIALFKGLHQMPHLVDDRAHFGAGALLAIALLKLLALVVSAAAGFRGGRVSPAVSVRVAHGLLWHLLIPGLPVGLAVACGVLGLTLAVSRDGWLSLFTAVAVTGDITVLPVLGIIVLPTWLLITRAQR